VAGGAARLTAPEGIRLAEIGHLTDLVSEFLVESAAGS